MKKKQHGQRNRDLSNSLYEEGTYFDWVVTTAFYSSIHFVEDKILPKKVFGIHCKNIQDVKRAYKCGGRHEARERLVTDNLSLETAIKYKWLDDKSRTSRYTTYKIPQVHAKKALSFLEDIYKECYK